VRLSIFRRGIDSSENSLEMGRSAGDFCSLSNAPTSGLLFSVWTRIPDPGVVPWSRGRMVVYIVRGTNWEIECSVGLSSANVNSVARYQADMTYLAGSSRTLVGTFALYDSGLNLAEEQARGWVWAAWQLSRSGGSLSMRQWLKFSNSSVIAAGNSDLTLTNARQQLVGAGWTAAQASAWVPSLNSSFQVGGDNCYLCQARVEETNEPPSLTKLEAIAVAKEPDALCWAQYPLMWEDGAANLSDASGNGRHLTSTGVLHEGPVLSRETTS
jgi:hypothetical protein